ncbi:MAG: acyl carrier protein [Bacteroidetes bacterium]|nr:acyl carrier protein [Bacteroidota bacterium]
MNIHPNIETICKELCSFISTHILAEGIALDKHTPLSSVGIDSFSLIEIVLFIERQYGIVLADDSLIPENLKSVETIANCTIQQLKA